MAMTEKRLWELNAHSIPSKPMFYGSPQELFEAAKTYFRLCDQNPFYKSEQNKSKSESSEEVEVGDHIIPKDQLIDIPVRRIYTRSGFALSIGLTEAAIFLNPEKRYKERPDLIPIIAWIAEVIDTEQFEGAATGFYNAGIIQRKLGLSEKVENKHSGEVTQVFKIGDMEFTLE